MNELVHDKSTEGLMAGSAEDQPTREKKKKVHLLFLLLLKIRTNKKRSHDPGVGFRELRLGHPLEEDQGALRDAGSTVNSQ